MPRSPFTAPARPTLATTDPEVGLEVHRVYCVGKNYAAHVAEMGGEAGQPPVFFDKPATALVPDGQTIPYPPMTNDLHYEGELVAVIGKGGAEIAEADALDHIWGYACGNDLTRRDLQAEAKRGGKPWDMAKGFDNSAVIGPVVPAGQAGLDGARLTLEVDGEIRQDAALADMIWSLPAIVAALSRYVTLCPGDVIYTGTPEGVGALERGQTCTVRVGDLPPCAVTIA